MKNTTSAIFNRRFLKAAISTAVVVSAGFGVNSFAGNSASSASTAKVVVPIAISNTTVLALGAFAPGLAAGTITINLDGTRTSSSSDPLSGPSLLNTTTSDKASAALFSVTGEPSATFAIGIPATVTFIGTTNASNTMVLTTFSDTVSTTKPSNNLITSALSATGAQSIYIGGQLAIGANQSNERYTVSLPVTVNYN